MTLDERKRYLTAQINMYKARVFDHRQQIKEAEEMIKTLSGAFETILDIEEKEKAAEKLKAEAEAAAESEKSEK